MLISVSTFFEPDTVLITVVYGGNDERMHDLFYRLFNSEFRIRYSHRHNRFVVMHNHTRMKLPEIIYNSLGIKITDDGLFASEHDQMMFLLKYGSIDTDMTFSEPVFSDK